MKDLFKQTILVAIFISLLFILSGFNEPERISKIEPKQTVIKGNVLHYDSKYKTGTILYFDAITRIDRNEVFAFDSLGNFEVSVELTHDSYGYTHFRYANKHFNLYLEPEKTYHITVSDNDINYDISENAVGNELQRFETALDNALKAEIDTANTAHNSNISISDYIGILKNVENKKLNYLNSYKSEYNLSNKAFKILTNKIRYQTAKFWINYRYDYRGERPVLKDTLPPDFYTSLLNEYPINSDDAYIVREYCDYISNIGSVMNMASNDERIEYYKTLDFFTSNELSLIDKAYSGDSITLASSQFKKFQENQSKIKLEIEARKRFELYKIYTNSQKLPKGFGRDLILSQAICNSYYSQSFLPTDKEWEMYKLFFTDKTLPDYLKKIVPNKLKIQIEKNIKEANTEIVHYTQELLEKYVRRYKGKVIYIDFWATWCSPCKKEIPFAKELHIELESKDVVFVNFCVNLNTILGIK